ncbi:MAG TPA: SH3 domain-containing protein [Thermomicrobiales bacterium]|nr:SH3 domain-containing protein [Thermomicrobiales bacterium]
MTSTPCRAVTRLRIAVVLAATASSLAPAASTAFAQSALYPGAVGLVADTGGEPVLLRETPSFDAAVLLSLSEGTPADILDSPVYSDDGVAWQPVSVDGMTGYVVAGYLIDGGQAAAPPDVVELAQEAAPLTVAPETATAEPLAVETAPAESLPAPAASPSEVPANPVTTADLNLRAGPSFGDSVLMVIPAGAALAPTGEWSQGFAGVTYEGNYGWVDSGWLAASEPGVDTAPQPAAATKDVALLQEVAPAPVTTAEPAPTKDAALVGDLSAVPGETAYATDVVNLRAGSSESSEVLRVLPRGGAVTITGEPNNGWTPVWYNGTTGYISANLLSAFTTTPQTTTAPVSLAQETAPIAAPLVAADPAVESGSGELAATTLSDVNLRGAPETAAPIMGTIPAGATLTALAGPEQGFYQVQYGQQIGWVSAEFLQVSATYLQRDNRTDSNPPEGKVEGSAPAANAELGAGGIIWPVRGGQWTIMQGYHGSSHQNQDSLYQYEYALDLARVDGNTAGQPIYSPVTGIVRWTDPNTGGISIDIDNGHAVAMFHVTFTGGLEAGTPVHQGQVLGEISGPGGPGFMGTAHVHLALWGTNDNGNWDRHAEPFTGQYAISGMDFPDTGGGSTYEGTQFSP